MKDGKYFFHKISHAKIDAEKLKAVKGGEYQIQIIEEPYPRTIPLNKVIGFSIIEEPSEEIEKFLKEEGFEFIRCDLTANSPTGKLFYYKNKRREMEIEKYDL